LIKKFLMNHKQISSCFKNNSTKFLNKMLYHNDLILFKLTLIAKNILIEIYDSNPDFIYLFPHMLDNNSLSKHLASILIILNMK
jgi:hypothetical protein